MIDEPKDSSGRLEGFRFAACLVNFMVWLKSRVVLITQLLRVTQTKKNQKHCVV